MNTPQPEDQLAVRYFGGSLNGQNLPFERRQLKPGEVTVRRSGVDEVYTYEVFEEHAPNERWEATRAPRPTPGAAQA